MTSTVHAGGEAEPSTHLCDTCDTMVHPLAAAHRRRAQARFRRAAFARPIDFDAMRPRLVALESRGTPAQRATMAEQLLEHVAVNGQTLPADVRAFVDRHRAQRVV